MAKSTKPVSIDNTVKLKVAEVPAPATPKIVEGAVSVSADTLIKKPEFLDRVAARTDVKRGDAKSAMEATLAVLAEIMAEGQEINVPPLGKLRVVKTRDLDGGAQVMTLKLRTMKTATND